MGASFDKGAVLDAMRGRFDEFYRQHAELRRQGAELRGPCPIHGGQRDDSFSVNPESGLWNCFGDCKIGGDVFTFVEKMAGADFAEALGHVGEWANVQANVRTSPPRAVSAVSAVSPPRSKRVVVAAYPYTDEAGTLLFEVLRYEPKGFGQRRPDGAGGWSYRLGDVRRVLYRLPAVVAAVSTAKPIYLCEGEKDADALAARGVAATCTPMGAGMWDAGYTASLAGADVRLLPDNDEAGRGHARFVAQALAGEAQRVRVVSLPDLPEKGDVSDWLASGGTVEQLETLSQAVAPSQAAREKASKGPPQPADAMFHGLVGEFVRAVAPHTEADPVAVLFSVLVSFGVAIGRYSYCKVGPAEHYGNLFGVIVGDTASGKGTSWSLAKTLLKIADPVLVDKRIKGGLSTGEGLITNVRDSLIKNEPIRDKDKKIVGYQEVVVDEGDSDKRLLACETEFSKTLTVADRDGNTLSAILRQAWDGDDLRVMTKEGRVATAPHIGVLAHITPADLKAKLAQEDAANGFANRFFWFYVQRSKLLPEGGDLAAVDLQGFAERLADAITFGQRPGQVERDAEARAVWEAVYPALTASQTGMVGAIIARGAPLVLRLSLLYALLDHSNVIRRVHLEAALALWDFAADSARHIFGDSLGDPVADEILHALTTTSAGLTRTEIRDMLGRHQSSARLSAALDLLARQGRAFSQEEKTEGRTAERWRITKAGPQGDK